MTEEKKSDAGSESGKDELDRPSPVESEENQPKPSSPWPSARRSIAPEASVVPPKLLGTERAAWAGLLAKIDRVWTTFESRLCAVVLVAEVVTLAFWIGIRALSATGRGGPGMVFRLLLTALVFGVVAYRASKRHAHREIITTVATLIGAALGMRWGDAGTAYFSNLFAWLQNASILVFVGGVSELAKRLTLWLALLGASLATAQGKHINVDVVMRFLSPRARVPVAVLGWLSAAVVSISAAWGFFDYVAVEEMRSAPTTACPDDASRRCPAPPSAKFQTVLTSSRRNFFLVGRQITLDLRSLPKVLTGTAYNRWMTPKDWNEWLRSGGWESRFDAADVKAFELPEDGSVDYRNPSVTAIPGGTESISKLMVPLFNLVFAFGLLVIGVRFVLRSLLAVGGFITVDPAGAHGDDELAHAHDAPYANAERGGAAMKETHS